MGKTPGRLSPNKKRRKASYDYWRDNTLAPRQVFLRGFRPSAYKKLKESFRYRSNKTLGGYSSGYHESVITTDMFLYLRRAKLSTNGTTCTLPHYLLRSSFFYKYNGAKVRSDTLMMMLENADTFRTDTAQTVLSAPGGKVAGHSGSALSLKNQAAAHNLLREATMNVLLNDMNDGGTKGLNKESLAVLFSAITVISMAPGKLARNIDGGTSALKAGKVAKANWEQNRNKAKVRLDALYGSLDTDSQKFVMFHTDNFLDSTQKNVNVQRRSLCSANPHTPFRGPSQVVPGEVGGEDYSLNGAFPPPLDLRAPAAPESFGAYVTQVFRGDRRE